MRIERPETLEEAWKMLGEADAKALAGGTNVMVDIKKGREQAQCLVSLDALEELKRIERKTDGLHIGSLVTFSELEAYLSVYAKENPALDALREAASQVGGPQIRNRGTIGGNILCASPSSDTVPALLVLDARLKIGKADGSERCVLLEGFVTGVRKTNLQPGELLLEIVVPEKTGSSCFYKAGTRKAMAISVVNQAVYLEVEEDGNIAHAAVASGSVAPVALRAPRTEAFLVGKTKNVLLSGEMNEARRLLSEEIAPISDLRAEKEYRLLMAENILEENLKTLLGG